MSIRKVEAEIPIRGQARDLIAVRPVVERWLARTLPAARDLRVTDVRTPAGAGVANETLMVDTVQAIDDTERPVGYVIRVDTPEHLFMDTDILVHYRMYEALGQEPGIPVPRVLAFEHDTGILGQRFFLMERIEGRVPPDNPPYQLDGWVTQISTEERRAIWHATVDVMARIHAVDPARLPFLQRPHLGRTGLEQEYNYWVNYSRWCGSDRHRIVEAGRAWLADHFPQDPPTGLSWGDARPQNVMFQGTRIAAIFDWDMVSLAGPDVDLAWWQIMDQPFTVCRGLPRLDGIGNPRETVELYESISGRKTRDLHWHAVFNAYRLSSILIRLPTLLQRAGMYTPEMEYMFTNNTGIQWLAGLLDLAPAGELTTPWVGWDK
ncbi:MAG: phosphotransferase family protein [Gammaproteobacteria bacterium]